MKEMKRVLSLALCFVMLVGLMPVFALNADAAEGTTAEGTCEVTTTTQKTVYILSSGNPSGQVLIANSNTANERVACHLLVNNNGIAAAEATVKTGDVDGDGDTDTYIELADAAKALWTVSATSYGGYTFQNQGEYLRYNNGLSVDDEATGWSYNSSRLSTGNKNNRRYLRYNNGWTTTDERDDAAGIYFYVATVIEEKSTSTKNGVYSIDGEDLTKVVKRAGVTAELSAELVFTYDDGTVNKDVSTAATYTVVEDEDGIITGISGNTVTFSGAYGTALVKVSYTTAFGEVTDYITVKATEHSYVVPSDGTTDFPEYPNEGAIRYDKTATAVGSFSQTGIAQIELSMTGVPYSTGSEIDVVIMVDMSDSMKRSTNGVADRVTPAKNAAVDALEAIVTNTDGTINGSRVAVYTFNGYDQQNPQNYANAVDEVLELKSYQNADNQADTSILTAAQSTISNWIKESNTDAGTNYGAALEKCYSVLKEAREEYPDRKQYVIFVTDGEPTTGFAYETANGGVADDGYDSRYNNGAADKYYTYTEYYSKKMKQSGVEIYTVGIQLDNNNANTILKKIAGNKSGDAYNNATTHNGYAYFIAANESIDKLGKVFENIVNAIQQAATDVTVEDQITDEYTMIFDIPTGSETITGVTNDFYIEFGKYDLDENHERTTFNSVTKLYLTNSNGVLSTKDSTAPVFEQKTLGEKGKLYYWSTNAADGDTGVSVTVDGTTYYFVSYGLESGYNLTSGAYAHGTVGAGNLSKDLIIATPYFVYNANTRMIYWTVEKLDTAEYALRYFLYLDNSATEIGTNNEVEAGPYPTNDHAYITYTNFRGTECRQEFPVPQLNWNGAQVSYVFYLVNAAGQPINKSGQVVDFANAVFVTDVFTKSIVWNKDGDTSVGDGQLSADWLADDLLPEDYDIYDEQAHYALNVYENADGSTIKNQFTISGGTAAQIVASLNTRLNLELTTASEHTTKVYNTKAGTKFDTYGTYTSDTTTGIDFSSTVVAFAVVWQPAMVPDVVVVDYGLDVLINVVENDLMQNTVSGIGANENAFGNTVINTGVSVAPVLGNADLTVGGNTISIENENQIRFHQGDMEFKDAVKFFYESPVKFYEDSDQKNGYMYSSVTVIPATTIYYEDSFVELSSYTWNEGWVESGTSLWTVEGTTVDAVQAQDRPGESQISETIDADNNYGFDGAYTSMSTYSLGSAAKATVDYDNYAQASFTFYGTGFDVISMTSNTTGTILVEVVNAETGAEYDSFMVDTYYGYKQAPCHVNYVYKKISEVDGEAKYGWVRKAIHEAEGCTTCEIATELPENPRNKQVVYMLENDWIVDPSADDSLYQVPVLKCLDMPYGKYTVTIKATYDEILDHVDPSNETGSYDFYLDAIRIYDPANDGASDETIEDAYVADGEGWPSYIELRNQLIDADTLGSVQTDSEAVPGMIFIDGDASVGDAQLADYIAYGPNNEVYLAKGQSVAFKLDVPENAAKVQIGVKSADGNAVSYTINGTAFTVSTTTDMYYDLTAWMKDTIVITNNSDSILSITNIKTTYTAAPAAEAGIYMTREAAELVLNAMKPEPVNPFADVQKNEFFYESVLWAVENGITTGVSDTCFAPYMNCNRAQIVTFLWRAAGSPEPVSTVNPFADVKESDFYYKAVLWAAGNGITNGLTAESFGPDALCSRAQVVTFLWRANGSEVCDAENPFADVAADAFYHDAVIWALENGITTGTASDTFDPNGSCMRAHVVTFLYRAFQRSGNSEI